MKKFPSSTRNIFENPYISKNSFDINTNANSPIKVRKKLTKLIKVNSIKSYKLSKLTNSEMKKRMKNNGFKLNINKFILNNLNKHNSYPCYFYIKIANQLLFNITNHLVSNFKDNLIWNENYDYFQNFYNIKKSIELLPKIGNYYETYTLFLPIYFPLKDIKFIISKYIKYKIKFLETTENKDDVIDEIKDIDKNIFVTNNSKEKNKINKYMNNRNIKTEAKNNDNKLINTTEIITEKSCSVSNYFGIDSVIKCRESSNYGENNNFENQLINYSLLNQIKKNIKNKQKEKKTNLDFSLELASIIQYFDENEKNYYKNKTTSKIKSSISKKFNYLKKNNLFIGLKKYKTNNNYYHKKKILNKKKQNYANISLKKKGLINNNYLQILNNNLLLTSYKSDIYKKYERDNKFKLLLKNKIKINSKDFSYDHHLTLNSYTYTNLNKHNNDIIKPINNYKKIYNIYTTNKENKRTLSYYLYKDQNNPKSTKNKNKYNLVRKEEENNKIFLKKSKESLMKEINNAYKKRIHKRNNLSKFFHKIYPKKTKESNRILNTSPSLSIKRRKNNSLKRNNICKSQSQKFDYIKFLSNLDTKKIIFVNKKKENINSLKANNALNQNNTLSSSHKDFISLFNKKASNKILVHKKEKINPQKNKKINLTKNKTNFLQINNLDIKNSLKNYRSFIETEYNTFIPNLIIKKLFFNKINNENNRNNSSSKCSSLKKHNISSKNNQKIFSNGGENIEKRKINCKKLIEIKTPITNSSNKVIKTKEKPSKFEKSKKIVPKSEILSPVKEKLQRKFKNMSQASIFSINNKSPIFKNLNKNNNIKKNNFSKINKSKYNNTIQEINERKINNLKKSFVQKNNFMININFYNDIKLNTENTNDSIKTKKIEIPDNSLKQSFIINKNNNLTKIGTLRNKNNYHKDSYNAINIKKNVIKKK